MSNKRNIRFKLLLERSGNKIAYNYDLFSTKYIK